MPKRAYYSVRSGKRDGAVRFDLEMLRRLILTLYKLFDQRCYFQEAFGYSCVDAGEVAGTLGYDIQAQILLRVRKDELWPIEEKINEYSEDDLFDMVEFLFDCASSSLSE